MKNGEFWELSKCSVYLDTFYSFGNAFGNALFKTIVAFFTLNLGEKQLHITIPFLASIDDSR